MGWLLDEEGVEGGLWSSGARPSGVWTGPIPRTNGLRPPRQLDFLPSRRHLAKSQEPRGEGRGQDMRPTDEPKVDLGHQSRGDFQKKTSR